MTIQEIRSQWEEGLTPLSVIKMQGKVLVILEKKGYYHCHRYFQIGNQWTCSIDGQVVTLASVFSWLNSPTATTTREIVTPVPADEQECGHSKNEDHMLCSNCGDCREDLNSNELCADCR